MVGLVKKILYAKELSYGQPTGVSGTWVVSTPTSEGIELCSAC
jgi:hypothetical protein